MLCVTRPVILLILIFTLAAAMRPVMMPTAWCVQSATFWTSAWKHLLISTKKKVMNYKKGKSGSVGWILRGARMFLLKFMTINQIVLEFFDPKKQRFICVKGQWGCSCVYIGWNTFIRKGFKRRRGSVPTFLSKTTFSTKRFLSSFLTSVSQWTHRL